ncbi:squalene synthetase-like protein [Knufia fluminis]|uniref:Squalene synthetase-like protein n=1 Tax=Knufia fluminis TaxID=191047 RepID=A0AAN8ESH8_9EURO|nr:squalene synthetase-like protein [Knufia fluminis]
MGAKERAGQRGKGKKAAKGSMKGQPRSQKQLSQSISVPDLTPTSRAKSLQSWGRFAQAEGPHGFTMGDEARHTGSRAAWGSTSFRTQGISFVSAGPLKREEDAWNTVSEDDSPQKQSDAEPPAQLQHDQEQELHTVENPIQPQAEPVLPTSAEEEPIKAAPEVNVPQPTGDQTAQPLPTIARSSSPTSDSEEEIVFSGRGGSGREPSRRPTPVSAQRKKPEPASVTEVPEDADTVQYPKPTPLQPAKPTVNEQTFASSALGLDSPADFPSPTPARSKQKKGLPFGRKYGEDELMQDYIDNMALDDSGEDDADDSAPQSTRRRPFKKTETFRMFKGDGLENAKVQTNGKDKTPSSIPDQAFDWDSDDLADFDDLSTTDEEVEDVGQVIRHRTRVTGAQYLVIADGAEVSDAKWMLHSKMTSQSAIEEVRIYEEIRQLDIEEDEFDEDDDDDDSDEDEDLQDLIENIESEDDENARIMNYTSRMTDEQIARALAKQEELGLGSDELMLFDGEAPDDKDPMDDAFGAGDDFISFNLGKHTSNRGRTKRNKKQRDTFPSAEAFADALDEDPYGAFDVMDFERPSLKPKKKGRKSDIPYDLDGLDEEIKDQLVDTWTKDREKKAERKRQREEARLTASLDAADAGDPAIIKTRIRQFLVQDVDTLKLSPMASDVRASVHRLAKALKLNSHSEGKDGLGIGRYPVLTKTPRTPYYDISTIWEIDALMNTRKFFPKNTYGRSKKMPRTPGSARPRRTGGGGIMAGATYRDGEEVGASAPEIGSDNKGRAMLEKMGWTSGMGIGAVGNKGSIDHVRHIVKTTKAGLG